MLRRISKKTSQQKQCDRYITHQIHIFFCPTNNHIGYSNHASPASGLERCDVGGTRVGKAPSATVGAKGVVLGFNRACCIKLRSAQTSPAMRWVTTLSWTARHASRPLARREAPMGRSMVQAPRVAWGREVHGTPGLKRATPWPAAPPSAPAPTVPLFCPFLICPELLEIIVRR